MNSAVKKISGPKALLGHTDRASAVTQLRSVGTAPQVASQYRISWWGVPGKKYCDPKTHAVRNRKPICGTVFPRYSEEQWCARGPHYKPECKKCQNILALEAAMVYVCSS